MNEFENFILKNHLSQPLFGRIVYECILLEMFMELCRKIDKVGFKNIRGTRRDYDLVISDFVQKNLEVVLSEGELERMIALIKAHVKPKIPRRSASQLDIYLRKQKDQCAVCGCFSQGSKKFHDDHIIPYLYVSENLSDNGQALCPRCNSSKFADPFFAVKLLIMNKGKIMEGIRIFY